MMTSAEQFEIPLSKGKLLMILSGSILFVVIGLWFVISPPQIERGLFSNPALILGTGIASIIFFGLCAFVVFKKLQSNKPGLVIDQSGITDNASALSAGHIPWSDIKGIRTIQMMNQQLIMVEVVNPEEYINRQSGALKRKAAEINYKSYGSPISISANALKCNFAELEHILQSALENSRK